MWKHVVMSGAILLALWSTGCGEAQAAKEPAVRLDRSGVWIEPDGSNWRAHVTVVNDTKNAVDARVRLAVTGLDGTEHQRTETTVRARPGKTEAVLALGGAVAAADVPERVLRYEVLYGRELSRGGFTLIDLLPQLETRLVLHRELLAGTEASLLVVARDHGSGRPAAGATVSAVLAGEGGPRELFTAQTNEAGMADTRFAVPTDFEGQAELRVAVSHPALGGDMVTERVTVSRENRILLTTDKPLYQPGQVIHMRALSLSVASRRPVAGAALVFEVMDSKGNKVFKKAVETDAFGVASADFTLANELNQGAYTVRALLGTDTVEKTVTVERYVLPKFEIDVTTDRDYYQPGDTLKGEVQADYFFGKPVAGAQVRIAASKFEIQFEQFAELEGRLDDNGHWTFELPLPDFFAGTPIEQGQASVRLNAVVIDTAEHREEKVVMKPVAGEALTIQAVPEGGQLQPGVGNRIYVLVAHPDGSPADGAAVAVKGLPGGGERELTTDALGMAPLEVTLPADSDALRLTLSARDKQGRRAELQETFRAARRGDGLLLRTDKVLYRVGDTVRARVFASKPEGIVYYDAVRDGQTMLTGMRRLESGQAAFEIELDATLSGSIVLAAYMFTPGTDLIRDVRKLYVDPANDLRVEVALDAETYRPGETATFAFSVADADGQPAAAALGISIVDESVFALQEMRPGLEKVYFTLEQEIMKPRYEIHGYEMDSLVLRPAWDDRQQQAARFLLAATPDAPTPAHVNTFEAKARQTVSALQRAVNEDMRRVQEAINKLRSERNGLPARGDLLRVLLRKGYLRDRDIQDPWGNEYLFDFSNLNDDWGYFTMRSVGPDGIPGTDDDQAGESGRPEVMFMDGAVRRGARGGFGGADVVRLEALGYVGDAKTMPAPMAMEMAAAFEPAPAPGGAQQVVRVREYFPETLLFEPALIAGADGKATLTVDMADSITTWRMTAMASAASGALGSMEAPVRVFQDFFVDLDLPVSLTQADQVSIPVAIYNYLDTRQDIRLKFETADWFTLEGEPEQTISVGPDEVTVRYFPITVKELGNHRLTVYAYGSRLSDAIRREIEVRPNGERVEESVSDRISGNVTQQIRIPENAIAGASKILVKLFPGVFTQVVDGLDSMLRMPSGCFEQTSSVTYPNVLIVRYMEDTQQINPELRMTAEGFINAGYQRLLSYEVDGGGFSWFGDAPANQVLTAWGVKQFFDMAGVHEVDPAVIDRTRRWLLDRQQGDGSWKPDESYLHAESWSNIQGSTVLVTAYIAEALLATGGKDARLDKAVAYLREHWGESKDPYTLGILANALVARDKADAFTRQVLDTLHNLRVEEGETAHWTSQQETVTFSHGNSADVEATALAAIAFLNGGVHPQTVSKSLTWLIQQKQASGHWGGTQATILALKALLLALGSQTEEVRANIAVRINGEVVTTVEITPEDSDVMRLIDLGEQTVPGVNTVGLDFEGEGSMLYQVVGRHYAPWSGARPGQEPMSIEVAYDKTELAVNDIVTSSVKVTNNRPATANMVLVDLGIPPGFQVVTADLEKLVAGGVIQKYEMTGRQIILYFEKLEGGKTVEFSYQLRAKFPLRAKTPQSRVYEYYNPEVEALSEPVDMTVE